MEEKAMDTSNNTIKNILPILSMDIYGYKYKYMIYSEVHILYDICYVAVKKENLLFWLFSFCFSNRKPEAAVSGENSSSNQKHKL